MIGRSLSEAVTLPAEVSDSKAKGRLGELVEEYWFRIKPDNVNHLPDFPEAGVELKTTGVRYARKQEYLAKERLVLSLINPSSLSEEKDWESSTLLMKCRTLLILFYLFDRSLPEIDRKFVHEPTLMRLLELEPQYITQIARDWEYIRDKCRDKKAHELSEGDTTYLKACRKGSGGEDEALASQGDGFPGAKRRAFSFPASFVSRLMNSPIEKSRTVFASSNVSLEESARIRLEKWFGKSVDEICKEMGFNSKAKNRNYQLLNMLLTGSTSRPTEFIDAGIYLRTLTIRSSGVPTENLPFEAFDPKLLEREEWEDSQLAEDLERRYLIAVFEKSPSGLTTFVKAGFWTMPFNDRNTSRDVWFETVKRLSKRQYDRLPRISNDYPVFVNTHGRNRADVVETASGDLITKRSFWISRHYMRKVIESQLSW